MRRTRALPTIGLLLAAITAGTATPAYAQPARPDLAAQARDAGLSPAQANSLQKRVNAYLASTGGTQVAINKIDLDGKGVLLLTLPGESRAREIGASARISIDGFCEEGWFCGFSGQYYTGDVLGYYYCAYRLSMPFVGYGSYINHQTGGVSAHFYDGPGNYMYDSLRAYAEVPTFIWFYVSWIKPCGPV